MNTSKAESSNLTRPQFSNTPVKSFQTFPVIRKWSFQIKTKSLKEMVVSDLWGFDMHDSDFSHFL